MTASINWLCPVNWNHPLNRGLAGWWLPIQNQPGWKSDQLLDLTDPVYGNHGTLTQMIPSDDYFPGHPGGLGSVDFDASTDRIVLSDAANLSPGTGEWAISIWFNSTRDYSSEAGFLYSNYGDGGADFTSVYFNTTNTILFRLRDAGSDLIDCETAATMNDGNWHHAVGVRTSATTSELYMDGVSVDTGSNASLGDIDVSDGAQPYIGRLTLYDVQEFGGRISDLRIHNRALSASEVRQYYQLSQQFYPGILNTIPRRYTVEAPAAPVLTPVQQIMSLT